MYVCVCVCVCVPVCGCACGVMTNDVQNGPGHPSSNPGRGCLQ